MGNLKKEETEKSKTKESRVLLSMVWLELVRKEGEENDGYQGRQQMWWMDKWRGQTKETQTGYRGGPTETETKNCGKKDGIQVVVRRGEQDIS